MAFSIDGIVIDRIQMGIAEDFSGNVLYTLTQLSDAEIEVTAESKEAKDANGTLIKTFYTGKTGKFTANNAILDFNLMAEASGSPKQVASGTSKIVMPGVKTVKVGETSVELKGAKEGTVRVIGVSGSGSLVKNYTKDTDASETAFSITGTTLKLPTDTTPVEFVIKYEREVESGIKVSNKANKFPRTVRLTLKALAVDPCSADQVRACLIVLPSFQVSPETTISLQTDQKLQYTGNLQVDYCSADKELYSIYFAEDDVEE